MYKILRVLAKLILSLLLVLSLLGVCVIFIPVTLNLNILKEPMSSVMGKKIGRKVTIDNSITVMTSLKPMISIGGVTIHNPQKFSQKNFVRLGIVGIQLELLPLLQGKLKFTDITVKDLEIYLERSEKGDVNWLLKPSHKKDELPEKNTTYNERMRQGTNLTSDSLIIRNLRLENLSIHYLTTGRDSSVELNLEEGQGSMLSGKPLQLELRGKFHSSPYSIDISLASLEEFLSQRNTWLLLEAEIAKTRLQLRGEVSLSKFDQQLILEAALSGNKLESLNEVLNLDLPPLTDYKVKADFLLIKNSAELKNLELSTGTSQLLGGGIIEKMSTNSSFNIQLHSPHLQINDFIFENWKWVSARDTSTETGMTSNLDESEVVDIEKISSLEKRKKLLDPEILQKVNGTFIIKSDQVLMGQDTLGGGILKAILKDGRFIIDPLDIDLPGGSIELLASLKPGNTQSDASLKIVMKNFDIGVLARRTKPDSDFGGLVNVDLEMTSSAATMDQLLENGSGYFDFSGQLDNLYAGIIDLWAVNLIAAIATQSKESHINCAMGRWSAQDGLLRSDTFFIDTSKIRICGEGQVNLKTKRVNMEVSPTSKKPEFFSLATPIKVKGSFQELNIGVKKRALVGTTVGFITSPLHVPVRRIFEDKLPRSGADICTIQIGAENRSEPVPGCK